MNPRTLREIRRHLLIYAGLAPFVLIALFPIVWMAITAFKEEADLYRMDQFPFWFHLPPTLKNFKILFDLTYFGLQLVNSALLAGCVVLITLVTALPAGYVLARLRLPGSETLGIAIFATYLVPSIVLFLPLARVVGMLGLFDSWWGSCLFTRPSPSRSARGSWWAFLRRFPVVSKRRHGWTAVGWSAASCGSSCR